MKRFLFSSIALLVFLTSTGLVLASRAPRLPEGVPGELATHTVFSGGLLRTYRVYCPPNLQPGELAPVITCFHGGAGAAKSAINNYGIVEEAERRGWIAVFPEGTGVLTGTGLFGLQTWNGGGCCGFAEDNDIDDVGFFADLLDDLAARYPANLEQVCSTGMSNGAIMTYRLAVERPDLLAAVAPVAGTLETAAPNVPIPVLSIFGLLDQNIPFEGGMGTGAAGYSFGDQASTLVPFLQSNAAEGIQLVLENPTALAWVAPGQATTAYYLALDGGHTWPGSSGSPFNPSDPVHLTLPATPLMFDFFEMELGL